VWLGTLFSAMPNRYYLATEVRDSRWRDAHPTYLRPSLNLDLPTTQNVSTGSGFLFHCYTACTSSAIKISQTISISIIFADGRMARGSSLWLRRTIAVFTSRLSISGLLNQLVPALSVSARALAMAQCRPPGLQLLTPNLRRCLLNRRPHPRQNLITVGMAYQHPERLYRQKWYYVGRTLLLKVVMAGFARFLGLNVESLYFWLYGHAIKPDETVDNACYSSSPFLSVLLISLYSLDIIEVKSR
jgi:hypothetical protein